MAGLVPAIHAFNPRKDVDARHKAGHDDEGMSSRPLEEAQNAGWYWYSQVSLKTSSPLRR